jgi:hypothetical protein
MNLDIYHIHFHVRPDLDITMTFLVSQIRMLDNSNYPPLNVCHVSFIALDDIFGDMDMRYLSALDG